LSSGPSNRYPPPARHESHWPPLLNLTAAIVLQLLLPNRLAVGSKWVLPALEVVVLVALVIASPLKLTAPHSVRRRLSMTLAAVVSLANGIALVELCHLLLNHNVTKGHELIIAGAEIWLSNVLLFALWYWELDRGGPGLRACGDDQLPDFQFPQMADDSVIKLWRPQFVDYLYVSLTNAIAFSPTDTMPLSIPAKLVMGVQSLISLVTIGLVIARAVNIL
jgi:uncharacterized membrane protein